MKFLRSIFNTNSYGTFKLQFCKSDETWHVLDGVHVVYAGQKEKCLKFIHHMTLMNS